MKNFLIYISWLLLGLGSLMHSALAAESQSLGRLRQLQNQEMTELRKFYDQRALEKMPRTAGNKIDTNSKEYKALVQEYSAKRSKIRNKYQQLDVRRQDLQHTLSKKEFRGKIVNTGSVPANVNADVDLKANDVHSAKSLSEEWRKRGGQHPVEYYTVDSPNTPRTTPPENFNDVVKVVDPNTDTTLWTPETEKINAAKVRDHDAWTTSGGQKATGNREMSRDAHGHYFDNDKKFIHSDQEIKSTAGMHDEDLKTFSKSVSKAGGHKGANIAGENKKFYEQAGIMQKYGDPVEAGIVHLGDSAEIRKQKINAWKDTARTEMKKAQLRSQRLGDAADTARENLAQQMRNQGHTDIAQNIEDNRQKVADSNRKAAAENKRLRANNKQLNEGGKVNSGGDHAGEGKTSKNIKNSSPDADIAGGKIKPNSKHTGLDIPGGDHAGKDKTSKNIKNSSPDADIAGGKTKLNSKHTGLDVERAADMLQKVETIGKVFDSGTRAAGKAIDENRPLAGKDVVEAGKDFVPGLREYEASSSALKDRRLKGLRRQERIRQLDEKKHLSPDQKTELANLLQEEKNNPYDNSGGLSARTKNAANDAWGMFSDTVNSKVESYEKEMEKNARKQGRQKGEFVKDGIPMFVKMMRDLAQIIDPIAPISRGVAEVSTWESRQNLASMKDEMVKKLNLEATQIGKRTNRNRDKLSLLLTTQNLTNPDVQKKIDALLETMQKDSDKLDKLNEFANKNLQETDPKKLSALRNTRGGMPDVWSLATWRDDLTRKQRCGQLLGTFNTAVDEGNLGSASSILETASHCDWVDDSREKLNRAKPCPSDTVKLSDESGVNQCVGCDMLHGDFKAAVAGENFGEAQSLIDLAPTCGWVAGGQKELNQAKPCSSDTVKLSDENGENQCVGCSDLQGDFNSAVSGGDYSYAQSLVDLASNCGWVASAQKDLDQEKPCPSNTVKLSDESGENQCVACSDLQGDFDMAVSGGDHNYAQSLLDLAPTCGWAAIGQKDLDNAKPCPANTVKVSNESNENQCVPCSELQGDYIAAQASGDNEYARTLINLSGNCGWAQSVTEKLGYEAMMADLDQKCREQLLFSHAVISGDRYNCVCDDGLTVIIRGGQSACQSCEQIRGSVNSALQNNDLNGARGWMQGAQGCNWYNQAIQILANIEQNNSQRQQDAMSSFTAQMQNLMQQQNADRNRRQADINRYNEWIKNKNKKRNRHPPQPSSQKKRPQSQTPSKQQPARQSTNGCEDGSCCQGHTLYCKHGAKTVGPYPRASLDVNEDYRCDICNKFTIQQNRKTAPGLQYRLQGNYYSGCGTSY